jgi:predicted cobalt transporter CbtA
LTDTRFCELANTFKLMKQATEVLGPGEALLLRHNAFYAFIADVLDRFELFPELENVKLMHAVSHKSRSSPNETVSEALHLVEVHAPAAGLDPAARTDAHHEYVLEMIPFSLLGAGIFELARADARVQKFLALSEFEHGTWYGLVASLSEEASRAFGRVRTMHTLT